MSEHPINGLMDTTLDKIKSMVDVDTIIGTPITSPDGTTGLEAIIKNQSDILTYHGRALKNSTLSFSSCFSLNQDSKQTSEAFSCSLRMSISCSSFAHFPIQCLTCGFSLK